VKAAREAWFADQLGLDPDALVFIDETATATTMARTYDRAPRGERCRLLAPHGHNCSTSAPVGQIEGLHERRMAGSS